MRGTGRWTAAAIIIALGACESGSPTEPYNLVFDPANFVAGVDNPFFPLVPGTTFRFQGDTDEGVETVVVEVTGQTRTVQGIATTVVPWVIVSASAITPAGEGPGGLTRRTSSAKSGPGSWPGPGRAGRGARAPRWWWGTRTPPARHGAGTSWPRPRWSTPRGQAL